MCRLRSLQIKLRHRKKAAALILLGPMLAACSSVPKMPSLSSLLGSNSTATANANASNASAAYTPPLNFECPGVTVRQGAATYSVSANPAEPNPLNLRYQVDIGNIARECHLTAGIVSMKVGVRGRVVVGPAGGPGQVEIPLRIAVVHEGVDPKTIVSKLQQIPVTIPANDFNVVFTHVEDALTFPMPKGNEIDSYIVYVGFDPLGAKEEMEKKKPRSRSARPRRRT